MAAERKALLVRLPEDLLEDLRRLAAADLRSVNAEIEFLLREAVKKRSGGKRKESEDTAD